MRLLFSSGKRSHRGRAIFIDRDGVINRRRENSYVLEWSQFIFMPGIGDALREIASLQLPVIVISNQAAVGRGLLEPSVLRTITERMQNALRAEGAPITAVYYCTHKREDHCACRKPHPGLLHQASADFDIDLSQSVFIGDADTDVEAARSAGCWPVLFGPGFCSPANSEDRSQGIPVAKTAGELFQVTAECLRTAGKNVRPLVPQEETRS